MNGVLKKCIICISILVIAAGVTGCKNKENKQQENVKSYTSDSLELSDNPEDSISKIKVYDNYIYYISYKYPELPDEYYEEIEALGDEADPKLYEEIEEKYSDYKSTLNLYKYNIDTAEKTSLYTEEDNNITINAYSVGEDGQITIILNEYQYQAADDIGVNNVFLCKCAADGSEVSREDISSYFSENGRTCDIANMEIDSEGAIYAIYYDDTEDQKTTYCKINPDGELVGKMQDDNIYDETLILDRNNNLVVKQYGEKGAEYSLADFENGTFGEPLAGLYKDDGANEYIVLGSSDSYDILLGDSGCMYGYNESDNTSTVLLKWLDCGLIGNSIQKVTGINNGNYICSYMDVNTGSDCFSILREKEGYTEEREVITVAGTYSNENIQKYIINFNRSNDKYKIEYKSYDTYEDAADAFSKEIIAGNIPDIIDLTGVNIDALISKKTLCDLTPFMEADEVVNKDYFVDGLLDNTAVNGKQYYLVKSFAIETIAGKASELDKYKDNWNIQSLIEYYKSKPEGTKLMDSDYREFVFYLLFYTNINSYIDWDNGGVSFDSDEFKDFLEFCKSFPKEEDEEEMEIDQYNMIKEGKQLFITADMYSSSDIAIYNKIFDGDISYIGYPGVGGNHSYLTSSGYGMLAISDSSEYKDAAWEFIKGYMTEKRSVSDSGGNPYNYYAFPASKDDFENMVKADMATEEYTDDNGYKITPRDMDMGYIKVGPATESEIETLRDIIKYSAGFISDSGKLEEIISDDVGKYFSDEKSLDDTVAIIQDRMKKYVNENR